MNIGELGRLTGVSTKAIRYYEEIGVLREPERSPNGYRTYGPETVDRLRFVKDAQLTGLTLAEITTILDQRGRGESTCEHVIGLLDHHLLELDSRIETLEKTRSKLIPTGAKRSPRRPGSTRSINRLTFTRLRERTPTPTSRPSRRSVVSALRLPPDTRSGGPTRAPRFTNVG
jgi:DNA-binding transcriptional MerR regulator